MLVRLAPCPTCARHVRVTEPDCPFCHGSLERDLAKLDPLFRPVGRLSRAAIFAFGTTLGAAGCGSATGLGGLEPPTVDSGTDSAVPRVDSGPLPLDAGPPDAGFVEVDAGHDAGGGLIAAYGGPSPVDAGFDAGGISVVPAYGAPFPTFDGGPEEIEEDAGSIGDLYGAPPFEP